MIRASVLVLAFAVAAPLAGCGDDAKPAAPVGTPRAAVLGFIGDVQAGRYADACARLDPATTPDLRILALSERTPPAGGIAVRKAYNRRIERETKRCAVSVRLLAEQLGPQGLHRLRTSAVAAKVTSPRGSGVSILGNEEWIVEPRDGSWVITGTDAIPSAFEPSA